MPLKGIGATSKRSNWVATDTKVQTPNQALQTTPMTRSIYERTIEFGHPQRGV